ncbi:MAG: anaerobic ribonucleoside-triphosphate reductase activating protein [Candidatus Parcubacteria bacterium]|jgi:pyruvate formate lyase activating enzyme|nr:MAG: anaerobic ribonucleoside-triphosphate reductase activating protein [Candidatus Parcubacteria bacterium]
MIIGGLEKITLLDFPDKVAAIVFTQGCNFRCHFCYNPLLVIPAAEAKRKKYEKTDSQISENEFFLFLESRRGKLDGVVITGGEPTLHADLPDFIKKIRALGFVVKLDTNGTNPQMLKELLAAGLIDYLAMDLKAPLQKYSRLVGVLFDCKKIQKSAKLVINSGLPHEFRTTLVPGFIELADISEMGSMISGADAWYLQKFKSDTPLVDQQLESAPPFKDEEMIAMAAVGKKYVKLCQMRP